MNSDKTDSSHLIDYNLIYHWRDLKKKPKVIVLDLDHTLWNFYTDLDVNRPFKRLNEHNLIGNDLKRLELFPDVSKILHTLKLFCFDGNEKLSVASRAQSTDLAHELLEFIGWKAYFDSVHVYSCPKNIHMYGIRDDLKLDSSSFSHFLFFDDNKFNIKLAKELGICSVLVDKKRGLDLDYIHYGLDLFEKRTKDF